MKNLSLKSEPELMELKKVPIEEYKKDKTSENNVKIIIIFLVIGLCVIIVLTFFLYIIIKKDYDSQIQEKDNKIEDIQIQLLNLKTQQKEEELKRKAEKNEEGKNKLSYLDSQYLFDLNFYKNYSMKSKEDLNRLGYEIVINTHTLEKGMSHFELRPFTQNKTNLIIRLLKKELKYPNHLGHFSFINGINSLREYKKIYDDNKWTDKKEYKTVSDFLKDYEKIPDQRTGAYILTKDQLKKDYDIDYKKFIMSRHSTRNYKNEPLKIEDIEKAIEMAKYSASACNRQYIKVHYYSNEKMKKNVIDYAIGKGGLYLKGVNTFIITFDVNGLMGFGERNQGYYNAGLFSTNLVNAFHSLGIGTCFIQFANSVQEEEELKKENDIPEYERIAVILFAGYYDEKSIFAVSPRKDNYEYLTVHK